MIKNTQSVDDKLPLLDLFTRLREAGLPLGIGEYQLLLRALEGGFGVSDRADLKRLCQTLWSKSSEEQCLLDYHFDQVMPELEEKKFINQSPQKQLSIDKHNQKNKNKTTPLHTSNLIYLSALVLTLLFSLLIGFGFGAYMNIVLKNILPRNQSQTSQTIETNPQSPIPQPTQPLQFNTDNNTASLIVFGLLLVMAFSAEYVLIKWLVQHKFNRQSVDNKTSSSQLDETTSLPVLNSELTPEMGNQNQLAKSVLKTARKNNEIYIINFITREYFPVNRRQMKQNWRYLRRPVREGIPTELDIEATVNQIGQQGVLLEPVLLPPRINQSELLLLIDQDGSMVPFHSLSRQLAETAVRGGRLGKAGIYYFHNCPGEYLYRDSYHQDAEAISTLIYRIPERTVVLIFSDAGAARGGYSEERIELTRQFLTQLKQKVRYITWLNPIPQNRWYGTTADDIAGWVSMFEMTRRGLQGAINVLRGRK